MEMSIIEKAVCEYFGISKLELIPESRKEPGVTRRKIVYYLTRENNSIITYGEMGARYGQDHATVMYAVKTLRGWLETDKDLQDKIDKINDLIEYHHKDDELKKQIHRYQKREWQRKYYSQNREQLLEYRRSWRQRNREKVLLSNNNWKARMKKMNIEWCNNCIQY